MRSQVTADQPRRWQSAQGAWRSEMPIRKKTLFSSEGEEKHFCVRHSPTPTTALNGGTERDCNIMRAFSHFATESQNGRILRIHENNTSPIETFDEPLPLPARITAHSNHPCLFYPCAASASDLPRCLLEQRQHRSG